MAALFLTLPCNANRVPLASLKLAVGLLLGAVECVRSVPVRRRELIDILGVVVRRLLLVLRAVA